MARRCSEFWARLQTDEVHEVPLTARCELAAALATATVDTLNISRTTWRPLDADVLRFAVLAGESASGVGRGLIAAEEGCPRARAHRFYHPPQVSSTAEVEVLPESARPVEREISLRLVQDRESPCACRVIFESDLGEAPSGSNGSGDAPTLRAPVLVLNVRLTAQGGSSVVRKALEFR